MLSRRTVLAAFAATRLSAQKPKVQMFADAEAYERFMGRWSALLAPMLVDFAAVPDSGRILDVGSGTGSLAFAVASRKPACRIVGIDPSKEFTAYATDKNAFPGRVSFQVGDAQKMEFPDAAFDACASLLVWNFIPDPERALSEAIRVTKPGGRITAAVWDYGARMRMLRLFWDAVLEVDPSAQQDESRMRLCREGELADLWRKAGLRDVKDRPLDFTMRFSSFSDYWDPFLVGQGPAGAYVRALDAAARQKLRDAVKRRLGATDENRPIPLAARAWAASGAVAP